jgi:hypothetical protein
MLAPAMIVVAAQASHLTLFEIALVIGLLIGIFGHIIKSRALIITGILLIGAVSAYFSFVLQPGPGGH